MMMSPKEQWCLQVPDYDISFIKGGWLVDKSNRVLSFVNQEKKGVGAESTSPPMTMKVKSKYLMTNTVKWAKILNYDLNVVISYFYTILRQPWKHGKRYYCSSSSY